MTENILCCSCWNLEGSDDGSVGTLAVLDADWSVITRSGGVPATVGCLLSYCAGAELLTPGINPSVVTRTFI